MISQATVFLTLDRKTAVPEGDPRAQFLLVREGQDIPEARAAKIDGAIELIGGTKKAPRGNVVESREPAAEHRDPPHKKEKGGRHGSRP